MSIEVKHLENEMVAWDTYVTEQHQGTFFHLSGWKTVLEKSFGHKTYFLMAIEAGQIKGVLPLARVRSRLFGNSISSLPFCVYGGIVADNVAVATLLRNEAQSIADSIDVRALEFRNSTISSSGWPVKDLYVTFRKEILPSEEANLKAIPNRQRAMIRKGMAAGLASEFGNDIARFYRIYAESVRNLGTPVFSKKYLEALHEVFADKINILFIKHGERDVAGVLSFYFKDQVLPYYGGSTRESRAIKGVNDFMYWELMRASMDSGVKIFDFGRSKKGTGAYKFKKNWGFTPYDLPYEYYLPSGGELPDVNPSNPKYQALIETWARLPLPMANFLGPFLAKSLG